MDQKVAELKASYILQARKFRQSENVLEEFQHLGVVLALFELEQENDVDTMKDFKSRHEELGSWIQKALFRNKERLEKDPEEIQHVPDNETLDTLDNNDDISDHDIEDEPRKEPEDEEVLSQSEEDNADGLQSNDASFSCNACPLEFETLRGLNIHVKLKHSDDQGEATIMCKFCRICLKTKSQYEAHVKRYHPYRNLDEFIKIKPFECEQCQRRFRNKKNLSNHLTIHQGLKPYECDVCQKSFRILKDLNSHRKTKHKE